MIPRKGQKCYICKKVIEGDCAYGNHWYCMKCKNKQIMVVVEKFKNNQINV